MDMGESVDGTPQARLAIPRRSEMTYRAALDRLRKNITLLKLRFGKTQLHLQSRSIQYESSEAKSVNIGRIKINDISKGVDAIQAFLQSTHTPPATETRSNGSLISVDNQLESVKHESQPASLCAPGSDTHWDHSAHIIDFIKTFVEHIEPAYAGTDGGKVVLSLKTLLKSLENPKHLVIPKAMAPAPEDNSEMPPLAASVDILRWAQTHQTNATVSRMSHVLPLERFADICRKVYFAVDDFNEIEFILSNGYMYYIFCEHAAGSGREDYLEFGKICERNMFKAFQRLPLLLPSSMEVIAALILGVYNAVENSKASLAWSFISVAATQCQTLGYHRSPPGRSRGTINSLRASQERLFWTVYKLDKGLSLRFGRAPNILDSEITLPFEQDLPRSVRVARVQGNVYEQLYSPAAISVANNSTRIHSAEQLAEQLRNLIGEIYSELHAAEANYEQDALSDPLQEYHLQCDLVCLTSLLTLILRAVPLPLESLGGSPSSYVTAARDVFDIHHKCMMGIKQRGIGCSMNRKYINWAILNTPFVPFTILFTRVIQFHDVADLARLKRFTDSLCPDSIGSESITHPHQLYDLLCQAAQLYMRTNALYPSDIFPSLNEDLLQPGEASSADGSIEVVMEHGKGLEENMSHFDNLDEWFQGNQQLMSLLDENATF
ncbi:unnamed protein product [Clonostachys rosea]|uniref:Xylanolytic transcriptional activator regulatory domain-containing protein n=1 Tax=Bionectria ochroleuca TaxID=29856 RepID=A0ABY6UNL5_BIOOC|nr:unnamed protein product [Clonostachys rosea]